MGDRFDLFAAIALPIPGAPFRPKAGRRGGDALPSLIDAESSALCRLGVNGTYGH